MSQGEKQPTDFNALVMSTCDWPIMAFEPRTKALMPPFKPILMKALENQYRSTGYWPGVAQPVQQCLLCCA